MFELPVETEKLETHQLLLLTKRELFLQTVFNSSFSPLDNSTLYKEVSSAGRQYQTSEATLGYMLESSYSSKKMDNNKISTFVQNTD